MRLTLPRSLRIRQQMLFSTRFGERNEGVKRVSLLLNFPKYSLSPTRMAAEILISRGYIKDFRSMMLWNFLFYFIALMSIIFFILNERGSDLLKDSIIFFLFIYFCSWRVNELVFAFYKDALPDRSKKKNKEPKKGLKIDNRDRTILLTFAYLEIISWFGLIYYAIDRFYLLCKPFAERFTSVLDAIFLSGVTITSLGSNEFYASKNLLSRYLTLYEALIGIIFIAFGLAAYLGAKDSNECRATQDDNASLS